MQKAMNFNDIAIVSVKGSGYRVNFWYIEKSRLLYIFFIIYKNEWWNYLLLKVYIKKLNTAKEYYESNQ